MTNFSLPLVLDAVAKASLILAATALVAVTLRRASASARHFVWTLGLLSALVAPGLSFALPQWEIPLVTIAAPAAEDAEGTAQVLHGDAEQRSRVRNGARTEVWPISTAAASPSNPTDSVSPILRVNPVPSSPSPPLAPWPVLALIAWAAGASAILARMLLGLLAVQWMSRRTPEVTDAPWLAQARTLADSLGLSRVRFLRGRVGTMPMAWGIWRSSVLVPADADSWPAHRVRVVLLHELAHVKRRDCLTHLVAQLACAAHWFNPLVWMAARRLRTERELACDDLVLASGTRGSDYADQLLDIARVMQAGRFPAVFAGASLAMAQRSQLEGRLIAILDPSVPRRGLSRARAAAAAAIFSIVIVGIASVQPWAEERIAIDAAVSDTRLAEEQAPVAPRPIEQYRGQAAQDNKVNAQKQNAVQDALQGELQGRLQGGIQGAIQGGIQGGVPGGVISGVVGGVAGGIAEGVVGGVVNAVTSSVANAVATVAAEHEQESEQEQEKEKEASNGRGRDPRTINALMEALKDSDKEVRETAMSVLVQMRDPRMFEPLVAALKDPSADVRERAAFGLGQLRDARAITPLAEALKDANASVREQAVFALGQLRAAGAVEAITTALRDSNPSVREQAAFALGQIRDKRSIEPLISALKDENPSVRERAAFALGQMRATAAIEALVIALKDVNPDVREHVAFALGQIGDPRAIDALMVALKDANAEVRRNAAFALGQIR